MGSPVNNEKSRKDGLDEKTQELLKGCRWLLVKNRENLSEEQEKQLSNMWKASLEAETMELLDKGGIHLQTCDSFSTHLAF